MTRETLAYIREHMAGHAADGTSCDLATHMVIRLVDALAMALDALDNAACPDCGVVGGHRSLRLVNEDETAGGQ